LSLGIDDQLLVDLDLLLIPDRISRTVMALEGLLLGTSEFNCEKKIGSRPATPIIEWRHSPYSERFATGVIESGHSMLGRSVRLVPETVPVASWQAAH
jgi:hypothetical protein